MSKNKVDKIILLGFLLIISILFYYNLQNYESTLAEKIEEISAANISRLESKHFDLRNKYVQYNDADKYGLALSDLFLDFVSITQGPKSMDEAFNAIRSYDQIKLYIPEKDLFQLKSSEDILNYILDLFEKMVEKERPRDLYKTKFTVLSVDHEIDEETFTFKVKPFESFQIPKGDITASLDDKSLKLNSAPALFCHKLEKVEFESTLDIKNPTENSLP